MENQYCLFYKNDKITFGWVKETRKNKLVVLPEQGKEFTCAANRLEYLWEGKAQGSEKEALVYLAEKAAKARIEAETFEIEIIHELCESGNGYSVDDLALDFVDDPSDFWLRAAFFLCLKSNDKHFQYKKGFFHPRSAEEIERFEQEEIRKAEAERRYIIESAWAEKLLASITPRIETEERDHWDQFLHRLTHFLTYWESSSEKDYFTTLFKCAINDQEVSERKILNCLAVTERPLSWGALVVRRVLLDTEYDELELREVSTVQERDIWVSSFQVETKDLRSIETYTVDNEETRDFDDALSWRVSDDGTVILQIHIADVSSYIKSGSKIFDVASRRMSTLYTIKSTYPMLHPDLSENLFSLVEKLDRPAMTFEAEIDSQGEILRTEIYRSIISVNQNLSYTAVDELIEAETEWKGLWETCQKLKEIRKINGSLELDRVEIKLDISDPDDIGIKEARLNTPASTVIQELAILANYLGASFCKENESTALYRTQPPYAILREPAGEEKLTIRDVSIQPAKISLSPDPHSALGLECYLQATSPIRRFMDLVNQTVIFSILEDSDEPYTDEDLLVWAKQGEETQREYNQTERKLQDHWKFKYLSQHMDEEFDIRFMRRFRNGKSQINFPKLQLVTDVVLDGLSENIDVTVKINNLNLITKQIQLTIISQPDSGESQTEE